jgi:hypothetical protein
VRLESTCSQPAVNQEQFQVNFKVDLNNSNLGPNSVNSDSKINTNWLPFCILEAQVFVDGALYQDTTSMRSAT